jgi:hypothetical protein
MSRQFKVPVNLVQLTVDPSSATAGDIYFNSASQKIKFYSGTEWLEVGAGAGGGTTNHTHDYNGNVIVGAGGSLVTTATFAAGAPNNVNGQNGDVYVDITNLNVYVKSSSTWGSPTEINVYTKQEIDTLFTNIDNSLGDYVPLSIVGEPDGVPATDLNGNILVLSGAGVKFPDNSIQTTAFNTSGFATASDLSDVEVLALAGL